MRLLKTPHTAVVLVHPQELWDPIQAIRMVRDAHVKRWMPHISLLYPFLPADRFAEAEPRIAEAAAAVAAFRIRLARFEYFAGPRTAWLAPEPDGPVKSLQAALQARFPEFNDVARFPGGFRPHLSVGQGPPELPATLQAEWSPIEFEAREVALIVRNGPEDPFRVHRVFPLQEA